METQIKTKELLLELNAMINDFFVCDNSIKENSIVLEFRNNQKFELKINKLN